VPANDRKRLYEGFRKYNAVTTSKKYAKAMMATEAGWTLEEEVAEGFMYAPFEGCSKDNTETDTFSGSRATG